MIKFTVTREGNRFVARFPYDFETKEYIKNNGFRWDPTNRYWWTADEATARRVDPRTAAQARAEMAQSVAQSHASIAAVTVPAPAGLSYLPYQLAGIQYMLGHRNSLNADEMGCVDGAAIVHVNRASKGQRMTLATLYKRWQRWKRWDRPITTKVRALCDGELRQHEIRDVLFQGNKPVFRLTLASGKTLRVTADHEVAGPDGQWTTAADLSEGDAVLTNGAAACLRCGTTENVTTYRYAKFRGYCKECIYRYLRTDKWGGDGKHLDKDSYVRVSGQWDHPRQHNGTVPEHILVMETHLGRFLEPGEEVHHKNEDHADNRLDNLEVVTRSEHHRRHHKHLHLHGGVNRTGTVQFVPVIDTVTSVDPDGTADVYDIVMADPHRNFVANGIIVHNCGKTIQAIGVINADPAIKRVLVVVPASLKINWSRELAKWLVRPASIAIANGSTLPNADIVIANYDIIAQLRGQIDARQWDLLIADEAHYLKNAKAQRTRAVLGHRDRHNPAKTDAGIRAGRKILLTGTPIVNRPSELWTLVQTLDPHGLGANFFKFMQRYTRAHHNGYGWDFTGASNLDELQTKLRAACMVRRLKADVLTELPAKRRQVLTVPANGASAIVAAERELYERTEMAVAKAKAAMAAAGGDKAAYEDAVRQLRDARQYAFEEMSRLRRQTAVAKIPHVVEHVTECLENEPKVVVFVHHHEVGRALKEAFPNSALVTGEVSVTARTAEVDRFQHDPACRVFIGSIQAAGVGLTLTAAALVVFAELSWVPGEVSQSEDRLHRIGQRNSVLVQHLVFDDSVDSRMAHMIIEKQAVIDAALDENGAALPPLPDFVEPQAAETQSAGSAIPEDSVAPF